MVLRTDGDLDAFSISVTPHDRNVEYIRGPFRGVEALAGGLARKHDLRSKYLALFPGVYITREAIPTFRQRAEAAWLWSQRRGVLAGLTAARLHGAKWVDATAPIELISPNGRPPCRDTHLPGAT